MEKGTPHCKLSVVKGMVEAGQVRSTVSALTGGAALGFNFEGMLGRHGADAGRLLQEHDYARRPPGVARRLPAYHRSRRGLT